MGLLNSEDDSLTARVHIQKHTASQLWGQQMPWKQIMLQRFTFYLFLVSMEGQLVKRGSFLNAFINDFAFAVNFTSCPAQLGGDGYSADLFFILCTSVWMNPVDLRVWLLAVDMK